MAITLWKNKKSPLSIEEMDNNFEELCQRIEILEKSPHMPLEGITSVVHKNQELFFMGSRGTILGQVPISQPQWAPRGRWEKKKEYEKYDLVYHEMSLYLCHCSHTSEEFFAEENWTLVYTIEKGKVKEEQHQESSSFFQKEAKDPQKNLELEEESDESEKEEEK